MIKCYSLRFQPNWALGPWPIHSFVLCIKRTPRVWIKCTPIILYFTMTDTLKTLSDGGILWTHQKCLLGQRFRKFKDIVWHFILLTHQKWFTKSKHVIYFDKFQHILDLKHSINWKEQNNLLVEIYTIASRNKHRLSVGHI